MVEVAVRDEDAVDPGEGSPRDGGRPAQVHDRSPQHRIREQARPVESDDHGAVPEPGERIVRPDADSSTRHDSSRRGDLGPTRSGGIRRLLRL